MEDIVSQAESKDSGILIQSLNKDKNSRKRDSVNKETNNSHSLDGIDTNLSQKVNEIFNKPTQNTVELAVRKDVINKRILRGFK